MAQFPALLGEYEGTVRAVSRPPAPGAVPLAVVGVAVTAWNLAVVSA